MTLIELMVVIAIIALGVGAVTMGLNAATDANVRSGALRVVSASRFAYARATTQGMTVRLHFDFEGHTMAVEEAEGALVLASADDPNRGDDDEAIVDPWAAAQARIEATFEPNLGESYFGPVLGSGQVALEAYQAQPLADDVKILRLYTSHDPEPRTEGTGSIYFFPSGMAEEAVLWISDADEENVFSVIIHPLTGRARIVASAFEPEEWTEEAFSEDASEVRDPG